MANLPDLSLAIDAVGRRFGRRVVFSNVTAEVAAGRTLVVAGPNGSGKSTLLRIIAGLLSPSSGAVRLTANCGDLCKPLAKRLTGYVAPDLVLYPELTGVENLQFFGRLRGISLERADLAEILERVGLLGRGRDLVSVYSSGMRQRLKYAFALMHRPRVLLLDEPTANLDANGVEMVRSVIESQRTTGITIIATNEVSEVAWGDAVVRLDPK